ncbi:MAG TPA: molybdopterin cofactor-binding domain-containing protein, partial [Patescibacteria group bacterium]|nr:molybdopterin cofactor-binding domain-containing protein [Patescibacteria group bacterium]
MTGAGRFADDIQPEGLLHAAFIRSPMAHARIRRIDASSARAMPGVAGVFFAEDLKLKPQEFPSLDMFARPPLASEVVRFVGDAIGVVVAESRAQAADAVQEVVVDLEGLPVAADAFSALEPGAPILHESHGTNLASNIELGEEGALDGAEVVVRARFVNQRVAAVPMEGNVVLAEPDGDGGLRMRVSTQVPFRVRSEVSELTGIPESHLRVIVQDAGGGFGAKLATYPEQSVVAAVAMRLKRPV